ncbi:MAG: hypothetical protein KC731_13330 [Myxococcales bacterium]|nr:hypothetical protein [Myxococcales bacterium]
MRHVEEEESVLTRCAECGVEFDVERDRGYPFGADAALCFDCAARRGGSYDGVFERWVDPPRLDGLESSD